MAIYDISLPISETLAVWPGDTPYSFDLAWSMKSGASVNVGAVTMSVHCGTHVDAPFHFTEDGDGAGQMNLDAFLGLAVVADVSGRETITWDDLAALPLDVAPRLLLFTGAWTDHAVFPTHIPTLAPDVPARLGERGVVLLGVDLPSVDSIDSKDLPNHHALTRARIRILESLDLRAVAPGVYTLAALPLKLIGADAAPVRAVLSA
jgi:arylformamidase